jgi:hypothetical protein
VKITLLPAPRGKVTYSPSTATSGDVLATLTLDMAVEMLSSGRTAVDGTAQLFTKVFSGNVTGEVVRFAANNLEGQANVTITRIDRTAPEAVSVEYTPNTATS